jgi:hypothetical protein
VAAAERLAVPVPRALRPQVLEALQVLRAERVVRHEATPAVHPEAPERPQPVDAAVVAAAFN